MHEIEIPANTEIKIPAKTEIEIPAKTVEEAIEIALKELDAERGEVEIDVVSRGKAGILGIGSEPARVRVTLLEPPPDAVKAATEVLGNLILKLGVSATANLRQAFSEDLGGPIFDVEGDDAGLLIGRRGETLRALQFIVRLLVSRRLESRVNLVVEVEGYQQRRYRSLTNLALRTGERVATMGRSITLEPMPANERRIIHVALADHARVTTESLGIGDSRQVSVHLKRQEETPTS